MVQGTYGAHVAGSPHERASCIVHRCSQPYPKFSMLKSRLNILPLVRKTGPCDELATGDMHLSGQILPFLP